MKRKFLQLVAALLTAVVAAASGASVALAQQEPNKFIEDLSETMIQQLKSATTIEQQQPIVYQLQQIMINELPFIPLWYGPVWFEYQTDKAVGWPTFFMCCAAAAIPGLVLLTARYDSWELEPPVP